MSALFVVNKSTEFVGNTIRFDASSSTGPINIYEWDMDDGTVPIFSTSAISADYSYQNYGLRLPALTVWESSASDTYILPEGITVNPHPYISISGIPAVNSALAFTDTNGPYYFTSEETEVILTLDFGDGSPQVSGKLSSNSYCTGRIR
jgi:PKD repeat protein